MFFSGGESREKQTSEFGDYAEGYSEWITGTSQCVVGNFYIRFPFFYEVVFRNSCYFLPQEDGLTT